MYTHNDDSVMAFTRKSGNEEYLIVASLNRTVTAGGKPIVTQGMAIQGATWPGFVLRGAATVTVRSDDRAPVNRDLHVEAELKSKLRRSYEKKNPLISKAGFDPTRPDLHLGHSLLLTPQSSLSRIT